MDQQPFHITFYSYRGGSERTSALVNVGFELARRGRKVLLVDFDLESPALAVLPPIRTEQPHSGLVEYVTEYLDTNQSPPISDYLYHAVSLGKKGGEVWVMPAGREDSDYWEALGRLDWQALYLLHMGYVFFEDTRAQWQQAVEPHYILINAPAGINDLTGICTRQLPDLVAILSGLDGPDKAVLRRICADIQDERHQGGRDISLSRVLAAVPNSPDEIPRLLKTTAAGALGWDSVDALLHREDRPWPHDGRPIVLARPRCRLAREYRRFTRLCMKWNAEFDRDGALFRQRETAANKQG